MYVGIQPEVHLTQLSLGVSLHRIMVRAPAINLTAAEPSLQLHPHMFNPVRIYQYQSYRCDTDQLLLITSNDHLSPLTPGFGSNQPVCYFSANTAIMLPRGYVKHVTLLTLQVQKGVVCFGCLPVTRVSLDSSGTILQASAALSFYPSGNSLLPRHDVRFADALQIRGVISSCLVKWPGSHVIRLNFPLASSGVFSVRPPPRSA
jgi:hypothetical protein